MIFIAFCLWVVVFVYIDYLVACLFNYLCLVCCVMYGYDCFVWVCLIILLCCIRFALCRLIGVVCV